MTARDGSEDDRSDASSFAQSARVAAGYELADLLPHVVWTAQPDGTFDFFNRHWFAYAATSPSDRDVESWSWERVLHPDDLSAAKLNWARSIATGVDYEVEHRLRRAADGEFRWHLTRARALRDRSGEITKWLGVATDIHEHKRLADENLTLTQRLLEEQQQLKVSLSRREQLDRFRELLLGIVGHDLRSPIAAIMTSIAVVIRRGTSEADRSALLRVQASAERMANMVDQLLDLTRGRLGGGIEVFPRDGELNALCRDVIAEVSAAHPGARIHCVLDGELRGQWDLERLAQVLTNLLVNAISHGDPNEPVHVRAGGDDENAWVSVTNQGAPLPEGAEHVIFDPFRRVRDRHGGRARGLGLGLYIVHQIVTSHGGTVSVASSSDAGTTFTVKIPRIILRATAATETDQT